MQTIVINGTLTTVGPLSIAMPVAENTRTNEYKNFPLMTVGYREGGHGEAEPIRTGYLPGTTVRGFLRREIVLRDMAAAAAAGSPYDLPMAYAELVGQDGSDGQEADLVAIAELRESSPVRDLFGSGLGLRSRLLVGNFIPRTPVLPTAFTTVRKDLEDTDGVLDNLSSPDREAYFARADNNSERAAKLKLTRKLERDLRKARKGGEPTADLEAALEAAQADLQRVKAGMGDLAESTRTLLTHYALGIGVMMTGRLVVERAKPRDLEMLRYALDRLSLRPIFGAQAARGCGEIEGVFDVRIDGELVERISVGGWGPSRSVALEAAA